MGLFAENRHEHILNELRSKGRLKVKELAKSLAVTEVTIRRDLCYLQDNGLLKKTYGGAVLAGPSSMQSLVSYRQTQNSTAKQIIGKIAASRIDDGDNIYLEAGSTCYEIIPYLENKKDLTVIVNSVNLMTRLHEQTHHRILITGGEYRAETMDMIGPTAEAAISQLGAFTAFTSADVISVESGISGRDIATVSFTRQVLMRANKKIFVGIRSKFNKAALYKIADLEDLDCIITDFDPGAKWRNAALQKNIELLFPDTD
jgi:DeoR family transcriptional regulator, fructose operon transcriptional repressor